MINITVKTLDSQNHQFSVDENMTVEQFKSHIADGVNIPPSRQRIIYCGRVLQDNSKLADYDVDGKVVHLVQRAPPNASNRNFRSITPPPDLNRASRGLRGFERLGNTVYMGMSQMAFPQVLTDPQQVIPPRATHTLSSSRLNVARRMLRNAENVIRQLENPTGGNQSPPAQEESVEEEMTPVIEARVIVPSNGDQPLDGNAILNAVHDTIFPSVGNVESLVSQSSSSTTPEASNDPSSNTNTSEVSAPGSAPAEDLNSGANNENTPPRDGSRQSRLRTPITEMATVLTTLNQLQSRFAPFLERYQSFMQDDPQVAQEDVHETRQTLNKVSQVMHYLGHAYHSISDLIVNVEQAPPRLLLCRPILIQPPTVVQSGIPIQVEAQINLSADRSGLTTTSTGTTTTGTTTSSPNVSTTQSASTPMSTTGGSPPPSRGTSQAQVDGPSIAVLPGFVGLPSMPTGSMRVISTPVEIRTLRDSPYRQRPSNVTNISSTTPGSDANSTQPSAPTPPGSTQTEQNHRGGLNQNQVPLQASGQVGPNGGNLEFFMEVTPETLRAGTGNFIQSLMQIVGSQLGDTLAQVQNQRPESSTQANQSGPQGAQFQQSQARSTQTNPTTATHTRSTARPHVHMTQQAVQGGFDPFLHCYSHHISQSRPQRVATSGPQSNRRDQSNPRETGPSDNAPSAPPDLAESISASIESVFRNFPSPGIGHIRSPFPMDSQEAAQMVADVVTNAMRQQHAPPTQNAPSPRGAPDGQNTQNPNSSQSRVPDDIFGSITRIMRNHFPLVIDPTLDFYIQSFHPEPYVQGESILIDLIMLMLRNLRFNDLFAISAGNMAPLERQLDTIQRFFLTEVCQNDTSETGIERATGRIMNDFSPLIHGLEEMIQPRDNIDMARTIDGFFHQRLPSIIRLALNSGSQTEGSSAQNLVTTIWRATRELLALAVHCSRNGQEGVEHACENVMRTTLFSHSTLPNEIHNWTVESSRTALRTILQTLDIRPSEIEQYVVRNPVNHQRCEAYPNTDDSMEVDYVEISANAEPMLTSLPVEVEDTEPLPNVIWGSEPWHRQTPEEWVPIITRDIQRQRKQNIQPPFSDAYLSGLPSKRRKLISDSKSQGNITQAISETIQQAVTAAGLAAAAPLEAVSLAASESAEIQTAYRSLLQSTVQANFRNNEEFSSDRYPNASRFFNSESSTD